MSKLRVIVAGSRGVQDYEFVKSKIDGVIASHPLTKDENTEFPEIISGCALGVDKLGEKYAEENEYELKRIPANWEGLGKSAGIIRNAEMGNYAISDDCIGILVAIWDGKSRGTKNMINTALSLGLEVHVFQYRLDNESDNAKDSEE